MDPSKASTRRQPILKVPLVGLMGFLARLQAASQLQVQVSLWCLNQGTGIGVTTFFFLGGEFGEGPQVRNLAKSFGARDRVLASGVLDRQGLPVGIRCGGWTSGFRD